MTQKNKALLYNFLGFALIFLLIRYFVLDYTHLTGIWKPVTAFVVSTILSPKFQAVQTNESSKLFMKWIFLKGIKEIK